MYAQTAPSLAAAELRYLDQAALGGRLGEVRTEVLGGVSYVTCDGEGWDEPGVRQVVGACSALYAVFAWDGSGLVPLTPTRPSLWDDDLVTIQRYVGKTNEQFTRLLLNLAVAVGHGSEGFAGKRLTVLDPLCGRGTTLNHAVLAGHDAVGVDADQRDVEAYVTFFTTWLKDKRAKHQVRRVGKRVTFELGSATPRQRAVVIADDTTTVVDHLGKSSVDAVVADLPYGVQHGSRSAGRLQRRPAELLAEAAPRWRSVLRPGAGMAIAWNVKTMSREDAIAIVEGAGLTVAALPDAVDFAHRVDRAITRDVLIVRRPA